MAALYASESKAMMPLKAQLLDPDEAEAWFAGKHPRRLLAIPFGGPLSHPYSEKGADLDGDWFSERTDIYGGFRSLRETKERLVDWHHSLSPVGGRGGDPMGRMTGAIVGKAILDEEPEEDGWWVDFWLKAGEKRINLIRRLSEKGAQLFGSSQAIPGSSKRNSLTGEITIWPFALETLTTSPQNTHSVLRPAKAMLDEAISAEIAVNPALVAMLADLDNLSADLSATFAPDGEYGELAAKAGRVLSARNERALREALAMFGDILDAMATRVPSSPSEVTPPT